MYTLNRRNNGAYLAIVPMAKDTPRTSSGARKAEVLLHNPQRKNQAVKTVKGYVVISKADFDYVMWAPAWASKLYEDSPLSRMAAYWLVAKLDFADAVSAIKKRFTSKGGK